MVTTKNWLRALASTQVIRRFLQRHLSLSLAFLAPVAGAAFLCGCTPAGPRALMEGDRLLGQRKYSQAAAKLQEATRLLPSNAQAWNHLGLAYQYSGQRIPALKAYEQAHRCDPNLAPVRYNLGCLLLEQNDLGRSVSELTAYTLLQSDAVEGWLALGTAQLRSHQLDGAEISFQKALRLGNGVPEALNGLGVVQAQRRHPKEALGYFNSAVQKDPNYPPALLNIAILHQQANNRPLALQKYQDYLEMDPTPPHAAAVQELVRQLRFETTLQSTRPETTNAVVPSTPSGSPVLSNVLTVGRVRTNLSAARPQTNVIVAMRNPAKEERLLPATLPASLTGDAGGALAPTTVRPPERPAPQTLKESPVQEPTLKEPLVKEPLGKESQVKEATSKDTALKEPVTEKKAESAPPVETVQVVDEAPPKVANDSGSTSITSSSPPPDATAHLEKVLASARPEEPQSPAAPPGSSPEKRGVLDRLNPGKWFGGKKHSTPTNTSIAQRQEVRADDKKGVTTALEPLPASRYPVRHYTYQNPSKPKAGDRKQAERFFAQAVQAHRDGRLNEALENYRQAIAVDPSFFEAQYNLGLAAYELKELPQSLSAYETALSINPTSTNARYNFAVALEEGGYFDEAAAELTRLLEQHPNEVRAHFTLAGLYADPLSKPELARLHYRKVLELEPQHPEAGAIRFWLAANP
jgi:tetratricopeptide (TPR) repeat protein